MNSSSNSCRTIRILSVHPNTSSNPSILVLLFFYFSWRYSGVFHLPALTWTGWSLDEFHPVNYDLTLSSLGEIPLPSLCWITCYLDSESSPFLFPSWFGWCTSFRGFLKRAHGRQIVFWDFCISKIDFILLIRLIYSLVVMFVWNKTHLFSSFWTCCSVFFWPVGLPFRIRKPFWALTLFL